MEGSFMASKKQTETIEVVVVLPWVPETQIVLRKAFVIFPKKVPLSIVGMFNSWALVSSISSLRTAAL